MAAPTYRRAQVEYALWSLNDFDPAKPRPKMDSVFRFRIRRLLELDRALPREAGAAAHAFSDEAPGGRGEDATFSPLDALMLYIGLDLLHLGLKQQEVVTWLRRARRRFGDALATLLDAKTSGLRPVYGADGALQSFSEHRKQSGEINDVFLALKQIDKASASPTRRRGSRSQDLEHGMLIDASSMRDLFAPSRSGALLLIAVGNAALDLPEFLAEAPEPKRAPKRRRD